MHAPEKVAPKAAQWQHRQQKPAAKRESFSPGTCFPRWQQLMSCQLLQTKAAENQMPQTYILNRALC